MSHRPLRAAVAAVAAACICLAVPRRAACEQPALEVPASITGWVREIHRLRGERKTDFVRELSDLAGEALYRWVADSLRQHTAASVIAALRTAFPVVDEASLPYRERRERIDRSPGDLVVNVAVWQRGNREVLWMGINQRSAAANRTEQEQYLVNRPPVIFAKDGQRVIAGVLVGQDGLRFRFGDYGYVPFASMAFIEPPGRGGWPDVLTARGPEGQGAYMAPCQLHFVEASSGAWQSILADEEGYASGTLTYEGQQQLLKGCWYDRYGGEGDCETLHIRHGSALEPYRIVHRLLPGLPDPEPMSEGLAAVLHESVSEP